MNQKTVAKWKKLPTPGPRGSKPTMLLIEEEAIIAFLGRELARR
jgi:hypothetical protein